MDILYFLLGIVLGGLITALVFYFYSKSKKTYSEEEFSLLESERNELDLSMKLAEGKLQNIQVEHTQLKEELILEREKSSKFSVLLATRTEELKNIGQRLEDQKKDMEALQEKFQIQFKNLANEILEEKTKKFTDQNKINISEILNPLKEKITEELKARGLSPDTNGPSLRINLGVVVADKVQTRETNVTSDPFTYSGQRNYYWEVREIPVNTYREGSVTIHFVNNPGNVLVWAGTISEVVPKKQEDKLAAIQDAVDQIFKYIDINNK